MELAAVESAWWRSGSGVAAGTGMELAAVELVAVESLAAESAAVESLAVERWWRNWRLECGVAGGTGNGNAGGMSSNGGGVAANPTRAVRRRDRTESLCHHAAIPARLGPGNGGAPGGTSGSYGPSSGGSCTTPGQRFQRFAEQRWAVERPDGYVVGQPAREAPAPTTANTEQSTEQSSERVAGQALRPGEWEPTPEPPPKPRTTRKMTTRLARRSTNRQKVLPSGAARIGDCATPLAVRSASRGRFASNATPTGWWWFPTAIRPTAR